MRRWSRPPSLQVGDGIYDLDTENQVGTVTRLYRVSAKNHNGIYDTSVLVPPTNASPQLAAPLLFRPSTTSAPTTLVDGHRRHLATNFVLAATGNLAF